MQAMPQVVFTDALIVVRLDVDGQSFAPIGYSQNGLPGVQIQN